MIEVLVKVMFDMIRQLLPLPGKSQKLPTFAKFSQKFALRGTALRPFLLFYDQATRP